MIQINVDSKSIDRFILKLEKRIESYQPVVDATMEFARTMVLDRVEKGHLSDGTFRTSPAKEKFGRYSADYGKYDRKPNALPTIRVTLKYTGRMFKNFLINKGSRINVRNRIYRRSLYFSNNKAIRSNGKASSITYNQLSNIHDERFGRNYNLSLNQARQVLNYFKANISKL